METVHDCDTVGKESLHVIDVWLIHVTDQVFDSLTFFQWNIQEITLCSLLVTVWQHIDQLTALEVHDNQTVEIAAIIHHVNLIYADRFGELQARHIHILHKRRDYICIRNVESFSDLSGCNVQVLHSVNNHDWN